jgi:hypothetical protein
MGDSEFPDGPVGGQKIQDRGHDVSFNGMGYDVWPDANMSGRMFQVAV